MTSEQENQLLKFEFCFLCEGITCPETVKLKPDTFVTGLYLNFKWKKGIHQSHFSVFTQ